MCYFKMLYPYKVFLILDFILTYKAISHTPTLSTTPVAEKSN